MDQNLLCHEAMIVYMIISMVLFKQTDDLGTWDSGLSCPIVALIRTGVHNLMIEKMRHRLIAVTLLDCFHTSVAVKT